MCGIAGILGFPQSPAELPAVLEAMKVGLRHRGPDDEGIYLASGGGSGLVHTRLSILDLSPAGHQPMSTPDGRFWITFNGEIYNFQVLRDRLVSEGVPFASQSDTEVLLRLYERRGPEFVKDLRGMFSLAIWDDRERSCFLARGPLGIKPLYYYEKSGTLLFASEVRTLLVPGLIPRTVSPEGLYGYLSDGSVPEPFTLIEGVQCLPAGSYLLWKDGRSTTRTYWSVEFPATNGIADPVKRVREALLDSVRHHFVSDVPVSIFLSGGIDSTALVALARLIGHKDLSTFSISFDDREFDEGDVARRSAELFGTQHHDWRLDAATGRALLQSCLDHMDQPSIDGFNTFCVSKYAHEHGSKVVLSGLGSDEIFGGYSSFGRVPRLVKWSRALGPVRPLRTAVGVLLERQQRSPQGRRLGSFLAETPSFSSAYQCLRGVFTPHEVAAIAPRYLGKGATPRDAAPPEPFIPEVPSAGDAVSYMELTRYMSNQLLRDSDVMSMAWGLELRVPFVDRVLHETLFTVPASVRLESHKKLLLAAVPEIPEWVANRPKQGFTFPFRRWAESEWREVFQRVAAESPVPLDTWNRQWSILALENSLRKLGIS